MKPDKYRYQYRLTFAFGQWKHSWELVGQRGGLNLHITESPGSPFGNYSSGIEFHHRTPQRGDDGPPDHDECWLIKANCWHDGSSLYAQETLFRSSKRHPTTTLPCFLGLQSRPTNASLSRRMRTKGVAAALLAATKLSFVW